MATLFQAGFWMFFSAVSIGSLGLGAALLVLPSDNLAVRYQNFMLKRTELPLKDEHFSNMPQILWWMRLTGTSLLALSLILLGWAFRATIGVALV